MNMATLTIKWKGGKPPKKKGPKSDDKKPGFEIRFYAADGRRCSLYLGGRRYSETTAEGLTKIITKLESSRNNPDDPRPRKKGKDWVTEKIAEYPAEIRDKLAKAGLIVRKTADELWTAFLDSKQDIKETTLEGYDHAKRRFFLFFGTDDILSELTKARMEQWKQYLLKVSPNERTGKLGLAVSTTAGTISKTKAVFNYAVDDLGWLEESPLDGVGRGSFVNEEYDRNVTMPEYSRLLEACPCQEWRVIIALARIGGLRCPSEVLRLKWTDINWDHPARFYVSSSKTERYPGKGLRVVPLFPVLRAELERLFESETSEKTEYVINRYRDPERTNLGTQFARIVKMAGVQPIPRPFDNMRASRSTEVYAEFNPFLESKWIGHSQKMARKHYLQVREEDLEWGVGGPSPKERAGSGPGATVAQVQEEDFERAVGTVPLGSVDGVGYSSPNWREKSAFSGFLSSEEKLSPVFSPARSGKDTQGRTDALTKGKR
jgi:integrase